MTQAEIQAKIKKLKQELATGKATPTNSNIYGSTAIFKKQLLRQIKALESQLPSITVTDKKVPKKTTGSGAAAAVPPKKKPYVPASKEAKQGNVGRTTTKYDTPKGKAKVAAKPKETKRKVGQSGMGMKAYQNLNFNRRK